MRAFRATVCGLAVVISFLTQPAHSAPIAQQLLQAQEDAHQKLQIADQLKNLSDDRFAAKWRELGFDQVTFDDSGNFTRRADPYALAADAAKEAKDLDNLLSDGFEPTHPRMLSIKAEIVAKRKLLHEIIEGLKRERIKEAVQAEARVKALKNLLAPYSRTP